MGVVSEEAASFCLVQLPQERSYTTASGEAIQGLSSETGVEQPFSLMLGKEADSLAKKTHHYLELSIFQALTKSLHTSPFQFSGPQSFSMFSL